MGSVGAERRRPTPVQTPEEREVWRDGGRIGWRDAGREGRESGVVQSFSFDSYQLEEDEISKNAPERGVLALSEPDFEEPIPDDRYHGIYFAMLLAGVGFLLPYNSFITDVDYLHHKFQGVDITHVCRPALYEQPSNKTVDFIVPMGKCLSKQTSPTKEHT
nr:equilibrative nucleoside transporter 4 [Labrus bergylta]XP_020483819.1 equilibrative nucleoside transporter 4 [Labrus bergylta]